MLDVHPPHTPNHTWRDFFIHIATIVIGLLIAVGLEQTVEAMHDRHLRRELQDQLRLQTEGNDGYVRQDISATEAYFDWAKEQAAAVRAARDGQTFHLRRVPAGALLFPDTGVWLSAKDNGRTALLTTEEQVWYSDLYRMEQRTFAPGIGAHDRLQAALSALDESLLPFITAAGADDFELRPPAPDDLHRIEDEFQNVLAAARDLDRELLMYDAANRFVRDTRREHLFDPATNREYIRSRANNYAAHPRSQYIFSAR